MTTLPRSFRLRPIAALLLLYSTCAHAEDTPKSSDVFQLGEVEINATMDAPAQSQGFGGVTISEQTMQRNQALDVGQALSHVSGVTPTITGQRAESQVYIRGFNQNQVTLNVDGIPIYVPYDGNVDLTRLLTPNLSEIVVTKGLGSLMYGPNNMGGSINLITKRPDKPFTVDASEGMGFSKDGVMSTNGNAQLGGRINEQWYVTGGAAYSNTNGFTLSNDFTPVAAQPAGMRLNSASDIANYNFKIGFTPSAKDEYAFGVSTVNSKKRMLLILATPPLRDKKWPTGIGRSGINKATTLSAIPASAMDTLNRASTTIDF